MGKALDAALAHYKALGNPFVDVPEWQVPDEAAAPEEGKPPKTKPLRIFYQPLTLQEREALQTEIERDNYLALLVAKALDDQGAKLFTIEDEPKLKRAASSHVIQRIAMLIMSLPKAATAEDARKN